jgi:hypothetical protein
VAVDEFDVPTDGHFERTRTAVNASAEFLLGQRREPTLAELDPGRAGRVKCRWNR